MHPDIVGRDRLIRGCFLHRTVANVETRTVKRAFDHVVVHHVAIGQRELGVTAPVLEGEDVRPDTDETQASPIRKGAPGWAALP
jgi:hypothetical protein